MNSLRNRYHADGTLTYWSVFSQSWQYRTGSITVQDLAAMSDGPRKRVIEHLEIGETSSWIHGTTPVGHGLLALEGDRT